MRVKEILNKLDEMAPLSLALSYDNVGFLVGDSNAEVKTAVVALDCTKEVLDFATEKNAELIITHHPLIFDPLKSVTNESSEIVFSLISSKISLISMHTNLDSAKGGVNDALAKALELTKVKKIVDDEGFAFRKGELKHKMSADEFAVFVKQKLGGVVRYTDSDTLIKTVAVCGGSGGDLLDLAKQNADAFVTADVKHKQLIKAANMNYSIFDAGHFHTENTVIEPFCDAIKKAIPSVEFFTFNLTKIKTV